MKDCGGCCGASPSLPSAARAAAAAACCGKKPVSASFPSKRGPSAANEAVIVEVKAMLAGSAGGASIGQSGGLTGTYGWPS